MKTIAQQLNIKEFPFIIKDSQGKIIYYENSCNGWYKVEYDIQGHDIYYENHNDFWVKCEYDAQGNIIYHENSDGDIRDNRIKVELTMDEITDKFKIPVSQLKIKK
jgi:hypothetical protein